MELRAAARLNRDAAPTAICDDYLDALPLAPADRARVEHACANTADARAAMTCVHRALADDSSLDTSNPAFASLRARLALAGVDGSDHPAIVADDPRRGLRLISAPPIRRTSMAPEPWRLGAIFPLFSRRRRAMRGDDASTPPKRSQWRVAAAWRRIALLSLVIAQTVFATDFMAGVLPYHGRQPLELGILALFAILILWVSAGFWTAMAGFVLQLRGHDRYAISARGAPHAPLTDAARTAIVMPICNENVARVFAGLRATYDSVARTGELARFDFFVLSDSSDPDLRIAEREAWFDICRRTGGFERIFYRRRQHRIKRKSGNVADFCRRWGKGYDYMVVMDADSVMSGRCLVELMRLMQAHPHAGIIQTAPLAFGRETLYARIQQFATRVYGPLFVTGLHFWQLGESHYWGHNAIIRVAPFMKHCALGRLPGGGALSGEILSHDFVEAALMRRAGWGVWIAYDLPGSYEEMPPNLLDELKRDRRWCLGNLINSRLFFAHGLHPAHRAVFVTGVMAYLSAPLWFLFLVLSTVLLAVHVLTVPTYFVTPNQLFPLWPEWHPSRAIGLFSATATLLFLPKILGVALIATRGAQHFGGVPRLALSTLLEIVFSMLLAPVRMLFHTQFIAAALLGWKLTWKSPPREDAETTWGEALRRHGLHTLIGLAWLGLVYWLNPAFLGWLLPVAGALAVSIPISVWSSRVSLGRRLRADRIFLIPEESYPPRVLRRMRRFFRHAPPDAGFVDAVVDPLHNAIACAADVARTQHSDAIRRVNDELVDRALLDGPAPLTLNEKAALLGDALALSRLHFAVWTADDAHPAWIRARRNTTRAKAPSAEHRAERRVKRRDLLKASTFVLAGFALVRDDVSVAAAPSMADSTPRFDYAALKGQARALAERPYTVPAQTIPHSVAHLGWDQFQAIRFRPERALWADATNRFRIEFFHLGMQFRRAVRMHEIVDGVAHEIGYDPAMFDLSRSGLDAASLPHDLGFAGFRVAFAPDFSRDVAAFLGASYFRAVGGTLQYGLSARGLAVDCGLSRPEEFPDFTAFWFERPKADATTLILYALLDSPSIAGAYRFEITPGEPLVMRVEAALYPRKTIERLGVAPLTSMFLCGPNDRRVDTDWRPSIHDSDGLALWTGGGERIWRPLENPSTVRVNTFADDHPRGYGLLQRDRNFDHYQDDGVWYDRRPSLWVEPLDNWNKGSVDLLEIPIAHESFDNIVAFWNPGAPVTKGNEYLYAYRLYWGSKMPAPPPLAQTVATWTGIGGQVGGKRKHFSRRFVVDFAGGDLASLGADAKVEPIITLSRGQIELVSARPLASISGWRAMFDVRPVEASVEPIDIRLFLRVGDRALSETWIYQWGPRGAAS